MAAEALRGIGVAVAREAERNGHDDGHDWWMRLLYALPWTMALSILNQHSVSVPPVSSIRYAMRST
jgi:hypothetical protein